MDSSQQHWRLATACRFAPGLSPRALDYHMSVSDVVTAGVLLAIQRDVEASGRWSSEEAYHRSLADESLQN